MSRNRERLRCTELLLTSRIPGGARFNGHEFLSALLSTLASWAVGSLPRNRFLPALQRNTLRCEAKSSRRIAALGFRRFGGSDDSLSRDHCRRKCECHAMGREMKTFRRVGLVVVIVALLALAWYAWGPSHTPQGQRPLVSLNSDNYSSFKDSFNEASDRPRVVMLLSPT